MRKLLVAALIVGLVIWGAVLASIAAGDPNPVPVLIEPPAHLLPGGPFPPDASCDWEPYAYATNYVFCQARAQEIWLSYDRDRKLITYTTIRVNGLTVGDLMNVWGTPTGFSGSSWSVQVYWGRRSIWAYGPTFTPLSKVHFVSYSLEERKAEPWRGFVNARRG